MQGALGLGNYSALLLSNAATHLAVTGIMKTLRMAALLGTAALVGNLLLDWPTHARPEAVELVGASIVGITWHLGLRTRQPKS